MEATFVFARIVTGDESWFHFNHSDLQMSSMPDDELFVLVDQAIVCEKHILTVLWP
jgi:hypothetical protein